MPSPRALQRDESGFTLVELLVTMIIFSLAIAMTMTAVISVQRDSRRTQTASDATYQVRIALSEIDRQVRSGNVLYSPSNEPASLGCAGKPALNAGSCMRIFTQANGAEKCVQWQVLDDPSNPGTGLLRTRSWAPAWGGGLYTGWQTLARSLKKVDTVNGPWPFTLEDSSTPYNSRLLDVRLESVDVSRNAGTVLTSSLSGRNTSYGYDLSLCNNAPPSS